MTNATSDKGAGKGAMTAPAEVQAKVEAMVRERGEKATRERLSVSRSVLARVCAGLPVRRGSLALLVVALSNPPRGST